MSPREEAGKAILGYTIANDVSADNIHGWDHHLARSKAADTFCPLGPHIDTEFDPRGKVIEGYHNGRLLRRGTAMIESGRTENLYRYCQHG
jgi:2-keto-4-pentenoate hydratase/2-oxohepta-3-ene-1,7-dioic acid hydratase in catechol pathway